MKTTFLLLLSLIFSSPALSNSASGVQQLLQLVDYIGVDYASAVRDGEVIHAGEYGEMKDFSLAIYDQVSALEKSAKKNEILTAASLLIERVNNKADPEDINALSASIRSSVINSYKVVVVPNKKPNPSKAVILYAEHCSSCHGSEGDGKGSAAVGMDPPPIAFNDVDRHMQRSVFGLFNTITQGVAGTDMQPFPKLDDQERWSLAFYVSSIAQNAALVEQGKSLYMSDGFSEIPMTLNKLAIMTPADIKSVFGNDGLALMAYIRTKPDLVFSKGNSASLVYAKENMAKSLLLYKQSKADEAYKYAVKAYLEGFELIENGLDAIKPELRLEIEKAMTAFRNLIRSRVSVSDLEAETLRINELLSEAEETLDHTRLSGSAAFASAIVILLREGLEALLVIAALAAFLIKTGRRDALFWLYGGVAVALFMGGVTWWASTYIIDISGMQREMTEGIAALVAAAVLFYVGFWLHSKTGAAQWKVFIEGSIKNALSKSTLWGLAGLAFIAVFREILETVLFYQALWIQTEQSGQSMILSGFLVASVILAILGWLILRYSARLPLRQFFSVTSIFMFLMAIVFAGKGIAAMQEAGKLAMDPVTFPTIDLLGIYPNIQGLLVQSVLLALAVIMWWRSNKQPSTKA